MLEAFVNEQDLNKVLNYKDEVMGVTIDDIKRVAKQYLNNDYLAIFIEKGKLDKKEKIKEAWL